jgi:hypothetical protein
MYLFSRKLPGPDRFSISVLENAFVYKCAVFLGKALRRLIVFGVLSSSIIMPFSTWAWRPIRVQ